MLPSQMIWERTVKAWINRKTGGISLLAVSGLFLATLASTSAIAAPFETYEECFDNCVSNGIMDSVEECRVRCEYRTTPRADPPPPSNGSGNGAGEDGGGRGGDGGSVEGREGNKCDSVSWAPGGGPGMCHPQK